MLSLPIPGESEKPRRSLTDYGERALLVELPTENKENKEPTTTATATTPGTMTATTTATTTTITVEVREAQRGRNDTRLRNSNYSKSHMF
jgi:hypothetical protein